METLFEWAMLALVLVMWGFVFIEHWRHERGDYNE